MIYVGVDHGSKDWTAEMEFRREPDGRLTIISMHRYRHTIELEKDKYREVARAE